MLNQHYLWKGSMMKFRIAVGILAVAALATASFAAEGKEVTKDAAKAESVVKAEGATTGTKACDKDTTKTEASSTGTVVKADEKK